MVLDTKTKCYTSIAAAADITATTADSTTTATTPSLFSSSANMVQMTDTTDERDIPTDSSDAVHSESVEVPDLSSVLPSIDSVSASNPQSLQQKPFHSTTNDAILAPAHHSNPPPSRWPAPLFHEGDVFRTKQIDSMRQNSTDAISLSTSLTSSSTSSSLLYDPCSSSSRNSKINNVRMNDTSSVTSPTRIPSGAMVNASERRSATGIDTKTSCVAPRKRTTLNPISFQHNDHDDDDDHRLNASFDHDKEYVDLQPKRLGNCDGTRAANRKCPRYDLNDETADPPPKLRSFSEPEVRDFTRHTDLPNTNVEPQFSTNVLRHRFSNSYSSSSSSSSSHLVQASDRCSGRRVVQQQPFPVVGLRGRAFTADHTSIQTTTTAQFRHQISTGGDTGSWTDNHAVLCSWTSNENEINNNFAPPSFHSSGDDLDIPSISFPTTSLMDSSDCGNTSPDQWMRRTPSSIGSAAVVPTNATPMVASSLSSSSSLPFSIVSQYPPSQEPQTDRSTNVHATNAITNATRNEFDPEQLARMRWIRINRRFQLIVAVVVLIFSMLVFAVLLCWIVFAGAFVLAWDKPCDLPLKRYFCLASLQLVLDVFRTCILRIVFRWNPSSNESIPGRVIAYYILYFIYALFVLRLGITTVFTGNETSTCQATTPELFHTSAAFVSLSLAAWITIIVGYLFPFIVVAILLTINGYNPHTSSMGSASAFPFMSCGYAASGAPPGCVDMLCTIELKNLPDSLHPKECCICMETFNDHDVIVTTKCDHIFHKSCCREWLRQSRTCPVCRDDVPSSLPVEQLAGASCQRQDNEISRRQTNDPPLSVEHQTPSSRPVTNLLLALFDARNQLAEHNHSLSSPRGARISPTTSLSGFGTDIERG